MEIKQNIYKAKNNMHQPLPFGQAFGAKTAPPSAFGAKTAFASNPFSFQNTIQNEPTFISVTMHKENEIITEKNLDNFIDIVKLKPDLNFMTIIPINYITLKENTKNTAVGGFKPQNNLDYPLDLPKKLFTNLNVTRICVLEKKAYLYCQHGVSTYTDIVLNDCNININVAKNKFKIPLDTSEKYINKENTDFIIRFHNNLIPEVRFGKRPRTEACDSDSDSD